MIKGIIGRVLEGGADILDKVVTTKGDKLQFFNELEALNQKDRENSRELYKSDDSLQRIYALGFLISYILLILAMLVFLFKLTSGTEKHILPEWAIAFLSTLFGVMSAKISTITDFLFGSSKTSRER